MPSVKYVLPGTPDSNAVYTLSFDAYAYSGSPRSHNAGVYFGLVGNLFGIGWFMDSNSTNLWHFDARGICGSIQDIVGGYDKKVTFSVVIDPIKREVYGTYNFGSGTMYTNHFALDLANFANLESVIIFQDYRSPGAYLGGDFDNLLATTTVPEPGTCILILFGLLMSSRWMRRSCRHELH